jgi:hypothetical protein
MTREYLRRPEAALYLKERYGAGSPRTLAKLATIGGGPIYTKLGQIVLYRPADLDEWARSRMRRQLSTAVAADQ